jgi:hypothetical protein
MSKRKMTAGLLMCFGMRRAKKEGRWMMYLMFQR